jgi:hypothetical protein
LTGVGVRHLSVNGVDDNQTSAGGVASHHCLPERLGQKQGAEPVTLRSSVNRQTGQQDHPYWMGRQASHQLGRRVGAGQNPSSG